MALFGKQVKGLCNNCLTGKQAYKLDSREPLCPYIDSYRNKKCLFYTETDTEKESLLKRYLNKVLIFHRK